MFLVIRWPHEFSGVDVALLECGIDIGARQLLRHDAQLGDHRAREAADAELQALEVIDVLISLRNQPPICAPVLPAGKPIRLCPRRSRSSS